MTTNTYQPKHATCRVLDYDTTVVGYPVETNADPSVDDKGALWTRLVTSAPVVPSFVTRFHQYGNGIINFGGKIITLNGFNDSASPFYFQIWDADPTGLGANLVQMFYVLSKAAFSWTPYYPVFLPNGYIVTSSAGNAYTPFPPTKPFYWLFMETV